MIANLDRSDFSFTIDTIDNSDFIPEKLLALKQKTYTSGLLLQIEKNTIVSGAWKHYIEEMAEETVNNMQKQNMPKRFPVLKSVKQDNNCQLNLAFANAVHDPSSKFYGDDEDDNFHIQ